MDAQTILIPPTETLEWKTKMQVSKFQRGEDIVLFLEAVNATLEDIQIVTSISAKVKKAENIYDIPASSTPEAATFEIEAVEAQGGVGAGWTLTIDSEQSEALAAGVYVTNAKMRINGRTVITDARYFRVEDAI